VPRVSVIVAAYDAEATLGATLASVRAQTVSDWEVVVADDASADGTAAVATGTADPRVRVVRASENSGVSAARNLALRHATGELVAFLDSDDLWLPGYLEQMIAAYDRATAIGPVGIVCCDAYLQEDDRRLDETTGDRFGRPIGTIDAETLLRFNPVHTSALCPRAAIDEVGGFDASLRVVEDLDLWLRIAERGLAVVYVPEPHAVYRLSDDGLSSQAVTMARDHQRVLRRALGRGALSPAAARVARRALRLQEAAEHVALLREERRTSPAHAAARALVTAPLFARVALERAVAPLASPAVRSLQR
jgi:glycosyltransferase involved in cell wall biosynthesis